MQEKQRDRILILKEIDEMYTSFCLSENKKRKIYLQGVKEFFPFLISDFLIF